MVNGSNTKSRMRRITPLPRLVGIRFKRIQKRTGVVRLASPCVGAGGLVLLRSVAVST